MLPARRLPGWSECGSAAVRFARRVILGPLLLGIALASTGVRAGAPETDALAAWNAASGGIAGAPQAWRQSPAQIYPWVKGLLAGHGDTRYLARQLLRSPGTATRDAASVQRLAAVLSEWLAVRLADLLADNLDRWQPRLAAGSSELVVREANTERGLATLRARVQLGGRSWDVLLQMHRHGDDWRLYDAEFAGLGLLAYLQAVWAEQRAGSSPEAAISALRREAAALRADWPEPAPAR